MANNENQGSKNRGQNEGEGQQTPAPKSNATPAEIAKAISDVSARLADMYPLEQRRVLAAVKLTNGLEESTPAPRAQAAPRQQQNNNSNRNNNGNR